ncbi:MAG TPA: ABC transporter permease [Gammaproteobacteria bacterium]
MRRPRYAELIWYRGLADLHADAARGYVGFAWWVLEPLLYMMAFYLAFGLGLRQGGEHRLLFLLSGLVPWKLFSSTVQNGGGIIQANSGLIQQVYLPKYILPSMVLVTNGMKFLIILALLLCLAAYTNGIGTSWLALPFLVVVELMLTLALASLAAALVPLLPDLDLIISNGLVVMLFISGVINDISRLPPSVAQVLRLNPMVPVIAGFHDVLVSKVWPDWSALAAVLLASCMIYALALWLLKRFDRSYPKLMIV